MARFEKRKPAALFEKETRQGANGEHRSRDFRGLNAFFGVCAEIRICDFPVIEPFSESESGRKKQKRNGGDTGRRRRALKNRSGSAFENCGATEAAISLGAKNAGRKENSGLRVDF